MLSKCPMRGKLDYECGSEFIDENSGGPEYGEESDTRRRRKPHDADLQNEPNLVPLKLHSYVTIQQDCELRS